MNAFTDLCTPAKIYLILAITGLVSSLFNKFNLVGFGFGIIFMTMWTFILNWICNKGYTVISWFLVVLPLMSAFVLMGMYINHLSNK
jgi:hypothetical protein